MTIKTTIETINGSEYTVIWHNPTPPNGVVTDWKALHNGTLHKRTLGGCHIATALPALPRHPEPKDAALLLEYMKHFKVYVTHIQYKAHEHAYILLGVDEDGVVCDDHSDEYLCVEWRYLETTHTTDAQGNRVDVAINDEEE